MAINEGFGGTARSEELEREDEDRGSAMDFLNASKQNPPGDSLKDMQGSFGGGVIPILEALGLFKTKK